MESFVFNSFKERLMNGKVSGEDTWKFQPVKANFAGDYADTLKYVRSQTDLYYLNSNFSTSSYTDIVDNFSDTYYTNMHPVLYNYTVMGEVDVAHEPEYVTKENLDLFLENNPVEKNYNGQANSLSALFFSETGKFYRVEKTQKVIDEETGEEVPEDVPRGFYYIKTKEDLKWCADKINGENYNNLINIVLGDDIGSTDLVNINFALGENAERPYEGILYGNGYAFKNININCVNSCNGIVGYLGYSGWIDRVAVEGSAQLTCKKQISISHLIDGEGDVAAGFLCGKNNGKITNVAVDGNITINSFYPKIYSVYNKIDDADTKETNLYGNMFYPDYLCFDSIGNIVPYVGYFNEGVFATLSGYNKNTKTLETYWKTSITGSHGNSFGIKTATDESTNLSSPAEWYYFDGFPSTEYGYYVDSINTPDNRKNILFYDTFIAAQINKLSPDVAKFNLAASVIGLLPIDFLYDRAVNLPVDDRRVYDVRKKSRYTNYYTLFENASYFDKSIKLSQQNRAAYFVSPLVGINNNVIKNVIINSNIVTSGTFVGFIGGLVGKQLNGDIENCMVNISAMDASGILPSMTIDEDNYRYIYHKRDYYTQVRASQDENDTQVYNFPMPSIKNIGGLFGECIAVGYQDSLKVNNVTAFFNNNHVKVCKKDTNTKNARLSLPEDYYLLDKFAGITPIIELNTSNISDIWDRPAYAINESYSRIIKFKNLDITYKESLSNEDSANEGSLTAKGLYYKQVFNSHNNRVAKCQYPVATAEFIYNNPDLYDDSYRAYTTTDGAASPLVCELKPIYQTSPSVIETLFANAPYKNYSAYTADYTEKTYENKLNGDHGGYDCNSAIVNENAYSANASIFASIGLYAMDQNLASPASNPEFYGINIMTDLPGIQNPVDPATKQTVLDRFFSTDKLNYSYDIRKLFGKIVNWENCKVSDNHNVWTHPDHAVNLNTEYFTENNLFKYTVVPKAAKLPNHFSAYYINAGGTHVYTASHVDTVPPDLSDRGMEMGHHVVNSGFNGNKIPYTYPYFGSDFVLKKDNSHIRSDMMTNISGYRVYLSNPNCGATYTADGGVGILGDFVSGFIVEVTFGDNNQRDYNATACFMDGHGVWWDTTDPDYDPEAGNVINQYPKMEYAEQWSIGHLDLDADKNIRNRRISIDDAIDGDNDDNYIKVAGLSVLDHSNAGDIYHGAQHFITIDPDTYNNKKPLENMQFMHTLLISRIRDRNDLLYAYEHNLKIEKVEVIKKRLPATKYIVGYELNDNNEVSAVIESDTPPGLVSAYMMEANYVSANITNNNPHMSAPYFDPTTAICPADENGERIFDSWTAAALTAVASRLTIVGSSIVSAYAREDLYPNFDGSKIWNIPYKLWYKVGDDNMPGGASDVSAIWSAASGTIKFANGTTTSALLGLKEGFYLTDQTDIDKQVASMPREERVFDYIPLSKTWKYLMVPGEEIEPIYPVPWIYMNDPGKYYVDFLGSTYDANAATGILYQEAKENLDRFVLFNFSSNLIRRKEATNNEHSEYFKYTYTKGILSQNIGKSGFLVPVKYDEANDKAGFWFNMGETVPSAYNDDLVYASNILAIGKTPNQECILDQLRIEGISSVSFSGFTADDFDGLYVTDSDNNPVMYINVGLGECQDGTSWSYSSYPSNGDVSASGLILEVET